MTMANISWTQQSSRFPFTGLPSSTTTHGTHGPRLFTGEEEAAGQGGQRVPPAGAPHTLGRSSPARPAHQRRTVGSGIIVSTLKN